MEIDSVSLGMELLAHQGLWTEKIRDWIYPIKKKDPGFMDRVVAKYGKR